MTLGGGMFSYFTELNRKRPPVALLDFVTHATNPIVHAADDDSVMETLEALPHITRSTRAIIGGGRYRIGPSTIAMRQNPYGARTMPNPRGERDRDGRRRPPAARALRRRLDRGLCRGDRAGRRGGLGAGGLHRAARACWTERRAAAGGRGGAGSGAARGGEVLAAGPSLPRRFAVLAVRAEGGTRAMLCNLTPAPVLRARRGADARAVRGAADGDMMQAIGRWQDGTDPGWLIRSSRDRRMARDGDKIVRRKLSDQVLERMQDADPRAARSARARRCRPSTS